MDDAVAGRNVCVNNGRTVDHDTVADGKGKWVSIHRWGRHTVGYICCSYFSAQHMVEQNIREGCSSFFGVKVGKNNACVDERLVRRGKDRERAIGLKSGQQSSLDNARYERIVNASAFCSAGDVSGRFSRGQNLVDDVDDAVAGVDICKGDRCVVNHDTVAHGKRDRVAVNGWC